MTMRVPPKFVMLESFCLEFNVGRGGVGLPFNTPKNKVENATMKSPTVPQCINK